MRGRIGIHFFVGLFVLSGFVALLILAFKVSGLNPHQGQGYRVYANFSNIGGLKARAPVTIAGVKVGFVDSIVLDESSFNAKVTLVLDKQTHIPRDDASASILTEGLLGSNYVSITPGFEADSPEERTEYLKDGDSIDKTNEAMVLENLIGQLVFNMNKK
jgi:phospholipid/cholesterol/gamma-HCH transport system substrate-binding protein